MSDATAPARPRGPYGMEYARIRVPDLDDTVRFLQYHVGLQLEGHDADHAYLRADSEHHSIELLAAPELDVSETVAIGFSVEDDATLDDLEERVRAAGLEVLPLDERQRRLVARGFGVADPNGLVVELFTEPLEYAEAPMIELRPLDLVHPFLHTTDYEGTLRFYTEVLGFLASDHIEHSTSFLRCEDRYHHSLAISKADEFQVAHLCFMMKSFDHVMRMRARAFYKDLHVPSDIVNHSASTSIAFYIQEPTHGPRYELCDGHRVFTPEEHETHRPRRMTADPRNIDVWRAAADDWERF